MFDDTLNSSWDERSRRGFTTLASFGLQALAVGALLVLPLLRLPGLPLLRPLATPVSMGQPQVETQPVRAHPGANPGTLSRPLILIVETPTRIPRYIPTVGDDGPPRVGDLGPYVPGTSGPGSRDGVLGSMGNDIRAIMPAEPRPVVALVRISHMSEGDLIRKVLPAYPPLAR